jgi:hypothetical protein
MNVHGFFDRVKHFGAVMLILLTLAFGAVILAACQVNTPTTDQTRVTGMSAMKACITFDTLALGTKYVYNDIISDPAGDLIVSEFRWSDGTPHHDGYAEVRDDMPIISPTLSIFTNNMTLGVDAGSLTCVKFDYCDKGGNVNLVIDGVVLNVQDLIELDGKTQGVISISVTRDQDNCGVVTLHGEFNPFNFPEQQPMISFAVGGQELYIDNFCPCE